MKCPGCTHVLLTGHARNHNWPRLWRLIIIAEIVRGIDMPETIDIDIEVGKNENMLWHTFLPLQVNVVLCLCVFAYVLLRVVDLEFRQFGSQMFFTDRYRIIICCSVAAATAAVELWFAMFVYVCFRICGMFSNLARNCKTNSMVLAAFCDLALWRVSDADSASISDTPLTLSKSNQEQNIYTYLQVPHTHKTQTSPCKVWHDYVQYVIK